VAAGAERDLPPWGTIYRWFAVWRDDESFERINHALVMADRERVGRDASPTAAISIVGDIVHRLARLYATR
jgi:transposase